MKNLTWQNPEQLFVAQVLINQVKSKCCGIKVILAIPIPTLIRQKAWREKRINNINAVIKALVVAINAERDKQNEGVRKSVNKTNTKVYLTDSSTKVMNSSKPFRNQAE